MAKFNFAKAETETMKSLKDFQRATVERIDYLFRHGQNRVLVADEVGMGKTLIARGAIVKTAKLRKEENDDLLKVVYICSNTSIANQNIQKLKVSDTIKVEGVSDARLSMLHLKIAEQENDESLKEGFIQLLPLTPDTSFRLTNGGGTVSERALMFAILRRLPELRPFTCKLEKLFIHSAKKAWGEEKKSYRQRVDTCEKQTEGDYPSNVINWLYRYDKEHPFLGELIEHCTKRKGGDSFSKDTEILNKLRVIFAKASTEMLNPDLVIMDEFQRFKFLLNSNSESETSILAQKFFNRKATRILLLSATPYKLYSTLEEIEKAHVDEHYSEFLQVMDFLFEDKEPEFHKIWSDYSTALHEMKNGNAVILQMKNTAEDAMYAGVCRTERISVMESGDYTDDSGVKTPLTICDKDILSYIDAGNLLKRIGADFTFPLDYVKSCPFLMSFMKNYKVKLHIEKYFKEHPGELGNARSDLLWISPSHINEYRKLKATNARLEKLKEIAFAGNAELYLWIPPSKPYYALQGAYRDSVEFSKVLVFSSWEMVPRMIGSLISYEAERRTVGKLSRMTRNANTKKARYNSKHRYPGGRLQFSVSEGEPQKMSLFCLLYPSRTLASLYTPIQSLNNQDTLADIERRIKGELKRKLSKLKSYQRTPKGPEDAKWYYLAPMLMDGFEWVQKWINLLDATMTRDTEPVKSTTGKRSNKAFKIHLNRLRQYISGEVPLSLGRMPKDLLSTLTNMALGSPAICVYRTNGGNIAYATSLATFFVNYFNSSESAAVVELATKQFHAKRADEHTYWQDVLLYCKDGCFQAMFDEYYHLIRERVCFTEIDKRNDCIQEIMLNDLRIHTASYEVDTFAAFRSRVLEKRKRISDESSLEQEKQKLMRTHYAAGFICTKDDEKTANRKDSIRGAFNSPLRPFVLASTSIGQEGLDFHNYCRKIMHWNLPGNPIDLEQREGRINRFKCFAIRQNVAIHYGKIRFVKDIWEEMFRAAHNEKKKNHSDLVPFWCFGKNQKVKIERIVPMYPMSKDEISYERLIKILSLYRLTLGQARQEELLEYIFKEHKNTEKLKKLFINLSPFSKEPPPSK